jgi:hypothetical protein
MAKAPSGMRRLYGDFATAVHPVIVMLDKAPKVDYNIKYRISKMREKNRIT